MNKIWTPLKCHIFQFSIIYIVIISINIKENFGFFFLYKMENVENDIILCMHILNMMYILYIIKMSSSSKYILYFYVRVASTINFMKCIEYEFFFYIDNLNIFYRCQMQSLFNIVVKVYRI